MKNFKHRTKGSHSNNSNNKSNKEKNKIISIHVTNYSALKNPF